MKLLNCIALSLCLAAPLPALADGHVASTVTIDRTLQYASVGQTVVVTEGENGTPEAVEVGMVFMLVDADDAELTFIGSVSGRVVDNGEPTGSWTVLLTE